MGTHDYVVRRIKTWHERKGDRVTAELPGYPKPPTFYGPYGRGYIPDVYVFGREWVYEVKEYWAYRYSGPKLRAFCNDDEVNRVVLVLCSGTSDGVWRAESFLERERLDCEVISYRDLPFW